MTMKTIYSNSFPKKKKKLNFKHFKHLKQLKRRFISHTIWHRPRKLPKSISKRRISHVTTIAKQDPATSSKLLEDVATGISVALLMIKIILNSNDIKQIWIIVAIEVEVVLTDDREIKYYLMKKIAI